MVLFFSGKMLDGWYCRSMANMQAEGEAATRGGGGPRGGAHVDEDYSSDSSQSEPEPINYRAQYNTLKKKLKYLIYVSTYPPSGPMNDNSF